jgi:hypothetical protein
VYVATFGYSQYEHPAIRVSDMRWRIRERLRERGGEEWPFGLDDGFPPKPKGMHWNTWKRLKARDEYLESLWRIGVEGFLERAASRSTRRRRD